MWFSEDGKISTKQKKLASKESFLSVLKKKKERKKSFLVVVCFVLFTTGPENAKEIKKD